MTYDKDDIAAAEALHRQLAKTPIYELLLQYAYLIDKRISSMKDIQADVYSFFRKAWDSRDIIPMDIAIHKINEETTFETPTLTDVIIAASSSFNASSYPLFVQLHKTYNWPKSSSKTLFT
ncbi:TPA: hypothetical protein QD004_000040 [Shewanella algae]|uniref:hypothetical protein n=1 Tax=Shewanella algae TaxID=38313 RepID=UPI001C576F9A|nr:hypothetical protein [Shewanella algae]HDS1200793.1 hypothetical protein [Shewanella algae]